MSLDYIHYAFMGVLMVAAFAFAWMGKIDVVAAFGIAGTIAGVAVPTGPSQKTEPAPVPAPNQVPPAV